MSGSASAPAKSTARYAPANERACGARELRAQSRVGRRHAAPSSARGRPRAPPPRPGERLPRCPAAPAAAAAAAAGAICAHHGGAGGAPPGRTVVCSRARSRRRAARVGRRQRSLLAADHARVAEERLARHAGRRARAQLLTKTRPLHVRHRLHAAVVHLLGRAERAAAGGGGPRAAARAAVASGQLDRGRQLVGARQHALAHRQAQGGARRPVSVRLAQFGAIVGRNLRHL